MRVFTGSCTIIRKYDHIVQLNTLRLRQHGRHYADDSLRCISLNENLWLSIKISLKFVPEGSINNNPTLFQIMAWRQAGDKPLSETMMVILLTHICVTRPQWVKPWEDKEAWSSCTQVITIHIIRSLTRVYSMFVKDRIWGGWASEPNNTI